MKHFGTSGVRKSASLFGCLLITGCGTLLPQKRTENAATRTADSAAVQAAATYNKSFQAPSVPSVTVSNIGRGFVVINAPITNETIAATTTTQQEANSAETQTYSLIKKLPLGIALLLTAAGLIAIIFAIRYGVKSVRGTAIGEGIAAGDAMLRDIIARKRTQAMTETDPAKVSHLTADIADLESKRGQLNRQ